MLKSLRKSNELTLILVISIVLGVWMHENP